MRVVKEAPMLTLCRIMHRREYQDLTDKKYDSHVAVLYCEDHRIQYFASSQREHEPNTLCWLGAIMLACWDDRSLMCSKIYPGISLCTMPFVSFCRAVHLRSVTPSMRLLQCMRQLGCGEASFTSLPPQWRSGLRCVGLG